MKTFLLVGAALLLPGLAMSQHTLSGTVTDAQTQNVLPLASVQLEPGNFGQMATSEGTFRFTNLATGTYTIKVSYIGYQLHNRQIELAADQELQVQLQPDAKMANEVIVSATRANEKTPTTYTTVTKEELQDRNFGQDLPYLLDQTPSTVVTSDAGAGIGYSGIRLRGTDGTRINVTLNGIPVNEAESHAVFFVDLPDLGSSVQSVQIQRGVGTSTNGPGAFGGSINLSTTGLSTIPYAEITQGVGSFNTVRSTVSAGTGLLNNRFAMDARVSRISSDGYMDRAWSNLQSLYLSGGYYGEKTTLTGVILRGYERTYQAWNGVPEYLLKTDRTFNVSGTEKAGDPYENETDNYGQDYYQLHFTHQLTDKYSISLSAFNTRGGGYYEQYKSGEDMADYGIAPYVQVLTDTLGQPYSDTVSSTDLVRRRWLETNLYGGTFSVQRNSGKLNLTLGGAAIGYEGNHYGQVIWARYAGNTETGDRYYENNAYKTDFNTYLRANYQLTGKLNLFGDVQGRYVDYSFFGPNEDQTYSQQRVFFRFFNPKAGALYNLSERTALYASYAIAHREPTRTSYVDVPASRRPTAERLYNLEAGVRRNHQKYSYSANYYLMTYRNQLVLTGKLDDVGNPIHQNVPDSYRSGVELTGSVLLLDNLRWSANATFSQNKIRQYTEFMADYDNGGEIGTDYSETDIAFSPNIIAGSQLEATFLKSLKVALLSKYVSEQYLDNTQNKSRRLPGYSVNDVRIQYLLKTEKFGLKEVEFGLLASNLFGFQVDFSSDDIFKNEYANNGYTYSYLYGGEVTTENWYFPQATRHYLGQVRLRF